jgi:cysteine desulfurase
MTSGAGTNGYWDAASSEPLHPAARETLFAAIDQGYADPRRLHRAGRSARLLLDNARSAVAEALGARPDEVSFTASGTAAVHLGLLGLHRGAREAGHIAHTAVEHSSVLHAAEWAGGGVPLAVDARGRVEVAPPPSGTSVLAVQTANHEVGTLQPVAELAAVAGGVPIFADACASAGRLPLPEGWTVAAASAHKWGGPAGAGVLLVRKGARWRQPFPVDERIDERVPGFENIPAALAAAAALQAVVAERDEVGARQRALVDRIRAGVSGIPDAEVVGDPVDRLPHLVTFSCLYLDGESLVTELDRLGFGVASGSACTASTLTPSHVLAAMGALTHGNVRVSLARDTTREDVEAFLDVLPGVVERLRAEVDR